MIRGRWALFTAARECARARALTARRVQRHCGVGRPYPVPDHPNLGCGILPFETAGSRPLVRSGTQATGITRGVSTAVGGCSPRRRPQHACRGCQTSTQRGGPVERYRRVLGPSPSDGRAFPREESTVKGRAQRTLHALTGCSADEHQGFVLPVLLSATARPSEAAGLPYSTQMPSPSPTRRGPSSGLELQVSPHRCHKRRGRPAGRHCGRRPTANRHMRSCVRHGGQSRGWVQTILRGSGNGRVEIGSGKYVARRQCAPTWRSSFIKDVSVRCSRSGIDCFVSGWYRPAGLSHAPAGRTQRPLLGVSEHSTQPGGDRAIPPCIAAQGPRDGRGGAHGAGCDGGGGTTGQRRGARQ